MSVSKRIAQVALIVAATATVAACAQRPKPEPQAPVQQAPAAQPQTPPTTPPQRPVEQAPVGPVPGSVQDFTVNVGDRVFFDFDQHTIRADARPILDAQAAWLSRYPNVRVRIEGNADERGTREYNLALGARRANAVRDYLVSRGVAAGRIETISYGKERPIDPGSNEEAWARNRNAHTAIVSGAR